ncbi:MAG: YeaH/YhbH family protein [Betaproteobacteria bacterium]|nr:YeaH/YhbH family protein [Betaproteobacteria bacterium]
MVNVIDRRFDAKNRSAVNRQRFFRRYRDQIRRAVGDAIAGRSITEIDNGERIGIPAKDLAEPSFSLERGGRWETVYAGNDQFQAGDELERPTGGGRGGKGGAGQNGEGEDEFVFQISREEFLNVFFDDLALPDLVRTQLEKITEYRSVRAGFTSTGVPSNINIVRSMRGAVGRRVALSRKHRERLRAAEAELEELLRTADDSDPKVIELREEIERLRARIEAVPFIDSFDLRFNNRIREPKPSSHAVMFCLMDVSGSMDEEKKTIAKRFFMLLYLFLTRTYEQIELVFIRHHTIAREVTEEEFFHSRESGGTVVSSALELMAQILRERYSGGGWNVYGAQASDGDNWENDSPICRNLIVDAVMPMVQYFAYIEITPGEPQNLWREYLKIKQIHPHFAMQRIETLSDIYPVFRELFKKKLI